MNCICRQHKDLIGEKCAVTELRETCITFPHTIPMFSRFGTNHPVTKEKILEILEQAERSGLVIQLGNSWTPMVVCCCCGDCCEILSSARQFPRPAELFTTNYYAEINKEKCSDCRTCITRCQMAAPVIGGEYPHINPDRCIGCILCIKRKKHSYRPKTSRLFS
jgi:electron transport complex protein RnfB